MLARTIESTILKVSNTFPVLLLTGPRLVGKTTLLAECDREERNYVTLDDLDKRQLAQIDPEFRIRWLGIP
jgi:predicted AAA+ superfamily ATPase